jgi:ankyrin repeat protein
MRGVCSLEKVLDLRRVSLVLSQDKVEKDSSLHVASKNGYIKTVKLLLALGVNINEEDSDGKSPLRVALENGQEGVSQELLQHLQISIPKDEPYEGSPLKLCIQRGYFEVTKKLPKKGADYNGFDSTSSCPWLMRPKLQFPEIVKLPLDQGANPNKQVDLDPVAEVAGEADHDWSALHCSAYDGDATIVQILVEKKADFNLQTKDGYTLFHLAVLGNHTTILDLLLSLNLSLNSKVRPKSAMPQIEEQV